MSRTETENWIELTDDAKPSLKKPYHAGPAQRKLDEEEIEKMLKLEVIELANFEWADPILCASEKCSRLRFSVDYPRANDLTVGD